MRKLLLLLLVATATAWAQVPQIFVVAPPESGTANTHFKTYVMPNAAIAGVTDSFTMSAQETTTAATLTTPCSPLGTDTCQQDPMFPSLYHTYNFSNADGILAQWFSTSSGWGAKKVNIILTLQTNGPNAATPYYMTQSAWTGVVGTQHYINAAKDVCSQNVGAAITTVARLTGGSNVATVTQNNSYHVGDVVWIYGVNTGGTADNTFNVTAQAGTTVLSATSTSWTYASGATTTVSHTGSEAGSSVSQLQSWFVPTDPGYMAASQAYAAAVVYHFNHSANLSQIGYLRGPWARGGEVVMLCPDQMVADGFPGYASQAQAKTTWLNWYQTMVNYVTSLNPVFSVIDPLNPGWTASAPDYSYADAEAGYAIAGSNAGGARNGFGSQGLAQADLCSTIPPPPYSSADWVNIANNYWSGGVVSPGTQPIEGQQIDCSDPTAVYNSSCVWSSGLQGVSCFQQNSGTPSSKSKTGSLVTLLAYAKAKHLSTLELYNIDALLAFDPTYCVPSGSTCGTGSVPLAVYGMRCQGPTTFVDATCPGGKGDGTYAAALATFTANVGIPATFFNAGWNNISPGSTPTQPSPWCPLDSNNKIAALTGFRLWDDGVKWSQIETSASSPSDNTGYTFTKLDWAMGANVAGKAGCPMQMLYQWGATPDFATVQTGSSSCSDPNQYGCLPPKDVNGDGTGADAWYLNAVGQVAIRYSGKSGSKGQIAWWGMRNEADSSNFWCWSGTQCGGGGNPANNPNVASLNNLVLMGWDLKQMTRCVDPTSRVISPDWHVGTVQHWFDNFLNTTITAPARSITITPPAGSTYSGITCSWPSQVVHGSDTFDIDDGHWRGTNSTNSDPTSVIAAHTNLAAEIAAFPALANYPHWNDEWGWNGSNTLPCQVPNTATGAAFLADSLLLQLSFSNPSISREFIYQWDNMCQASPSQTIVGLANDVVAGWATGGTFQNYTLTGSVYKIPCTLASGGACQAMFDNSKTCSGATISTCSTTNQSAGSFTNYTDISGAAHSVSSGVVPVGLAPIILTGGTSGTRAAQPTCSPNGGTFTANQSTTCSTISGGAIICYTLTGTTPATNGGTGCSTGTKYTGAITINATETLKAVAGGAGFSDSTVYSATFTLQGAAPTYTPACSPPSYNGAQAVHITQAQSLAICYTTDGSTPAGNGTGGCAAGSTLYSVPVTAAINETFKAVGVAGGWTDSTVAACQYTFNYSLMVSVSGAGTVNSAPIGINGCTATGGVCVSLFPYNTSITLTAVPGPGYGFSGWSGGGCSGTGVCVVAVTTNLTITANFVPVTPPASNGAREFGVIN